jgi:sodium-dependent dicarboxylate transporter 2/3/5
MMYLGSLMMALAVEESGLHKRIALKALLLAGTSPSRYSTGGLHLSISASPSR